MSLFIFTVKKKTSLHNPFKTKYKFKSISSVNSKDIFNEVVPSTLSDSPVRTCENRPEKMFSLRRLLRTNDKPKEEQNIEHDSSNKRKCLRINYKPIDSNKLNDFKLLNKKQSNQSKEFKKNKKIAMVKGRKLKNCYESEPNFNSSNSKQFENNKNNITDLTISDTLFRLVTPQILRGKTPNQSSIATEMVDRKSIPPSNNKDQESNISLEKACIKLDHCVDLILPHIVLERLKADQFEKQSASLIDYKPKYLTPNKIESFHIFKEKTKGRISSNLLVTQQSLNVQGEDMRSNSKTS